MKRRVAWLGAALLATFSLVVMLKPAYAATGCRVTYTVTNQWTGGFGASVTVVNLGDALNGWRLTFSFPVAGQSVMQGWNADWSQSGQGVTATNASWNGALPTNGTASLGFNGAWTTSNPVPATFQLNGTTCTGSVAPTTGPTTSPTTAPTTNPTTNPTTPPTTRPTTAPTTPPTTAPTTQPTGEPWSPPSDLVSPLAQVWSHQESTYNNGNLYAFRNYGWDQLFANNGSINYCVRWDSSARVTAAQRDAVHAALQRQYQKWMDMMLDNGQGWNNWPFKQVPVKVVGWAVRDRAQLEWTDNSVDIYVNNIRENAPQCSEPCGRFFNQNGNYPNCPGGASRHYDHSLWLTDGFGGGAGGDWGQRMGREYFMGAVNADSIHIFLHELGHTYGLDDFYDWDPTPGRGFIMKAGSASQITEFDKWMFRDWWRHLKSRYGR